MDEQELTRINARRRMRGLATFFMVVSIIGALAIGILSLSDQGGDATLDLIGRAIIAIGLFGSALSAWHGSRVAGVFLLIILLISPVLHFAGVEEMSAGGWARSLVYAALAIVLVVSAFRYHRLVESEGRLLEGNAALRLGGTLVGAGVVLILFLGSTFVTAGLSTAILRESEITETQIEWLREKGFLTPEERPIYLYFDGAFSMQEGGSLLSHDYVGGWWQENGELQAVWLPMGQVCEVKTVTEGSLFQDAIYSIHSPGDEKWVQLWLSTEADLHKHFISRLKSINKRTTRPEIQEFCKQGRVLDWTEIAAGNGISQGLVSEDDMPADQLDWLREKKYLVERESILNFYSYGTYHIKEGGVLLTDVYFGGWDEDGDDLRSWWYELGSICRIEEVDVGSSEQFAYYEFEEAGKTPVKFVLPAKDGQAAKLIKTTKSLNQSAKTDEQRIACKAASDQATDADVASDPD